MTEILDIRFDLKKDKKKIGKKEKAKKRKPNKIDKDKRVIFKDKRAFSLVRRRLRLTSKISNASDSKSSPSLSLFPLQIHFLPFSFLLPSTIKSK